MKCAAKIPLLIVFLTPSLAFGQCHHDSIQVLTSSKDLVELIRPCPAYAGTQLGTTISYSAEEQAHRTMNDLIDEYANHMEHGDVKVYDRFNVLAQHAEIFDSIIRTYRSFHDNGNVLSEMVYLENDVSNLTTYSKKGIQTLEEYYAPDSASSIAWRETGELFSRTTSWNMLSDTSYNKTYRYDQNGQFISGDFSKSVVLNKQMGRQAVELFKINEQGEILESIPHQKNE